MSRKSNWKVGIILGLVVGLMVASGGWVMGSNLGFKLNKANVANFNGQTGPKGNNWTSLPYNNPYATAQDLCFAMGISSGQVLKLNPINGSFTVSSGGETGFTHNCVAGPGPGGPALSTISNGGFYIRNISPSPTSGVIVGSSNEAIALPIIRGNFNQGPTGDNYVSVPYHTTWTNADSVCTSLGLSVAPGGQVVRLDSVNGVNQTCPCPCAGQPANINFPLVLGEALIIRKFGTTGGNSGGCQGGANNNFTCTTSANCGGSPCNLGQNISGFLPPHF